MRDYEIYKVGQDKCEGLYPDLKAAVKETTKRFILSHGSQDYEVWEAVGNRFVESRKLVFSTDYSKQTCRP